MNGLRSITNDLDSQVATYRLHLNGAVAVGDMTALEADLEADDYWVLLLVEYGIDEGEVQI